MRHYRNLSLFILLLIRDNAANSCRELYEILRIEQHGTLRYRVENSVLRLSKAGLLSIASKDSEGMPELDAKLTINKRWRLIQEELGISLKAQITLSETPSMLVKPVLGKPDRSRRHDLFVVMPFREHLEPIYSECIRTVADRLELVAARGDDWASDHFIVANIWDAICSARLVIADCTDSNPNVFYEIGLAHAVGIPVILLTQNPELMPHDIRHLRYIAYQNTSTGKKQLEQELEDAIRTTLRYKAG